MTRYVYIWNGIIEVGGNDAYYEVYSSRKKAIKHAIAKCERYGYIEPQIEKDDSRPLILVGCTEIIDYQGTFLGLIKKLPIS